MRWSMPAPSKRCALFISRVALLALMLCSLALTAQAASPDGPELDAALELYGARLLQTGARLRAYPAQAAERREEGTAQVDVTVGADGMLLRQELLRTSGYALLDAHALAMLAQAVPLTEVPRALQQRVFRVTVTVVFRLPEFSKG